MSIEKNRVCVAHIELELRRLSADGASGIIVVASSRGVWAFGHGISEQDFIKRPGSMVLDALVGLPDATGVDVTWLALTATQERDTVSDR
jgi:hypothetical protein